MRFDGAIAALVAPAKLRQVNAVAPHAERTSGLFKWLDKNSYAGTGLGPAICERIPQRYDGGRIRAKSPGEGQGATFSFSLPAVKEKK
jgi:signal transduction histidine kinase